MTTKPLRRACLPCCDAGAPRCLRSDGEQAAFIAEVPASELAETSERLSFIRVRQKELSSALSVEQLRLQSLFSFLPSAAKTVSLGLELQALAIEQQTLEAKVGAEAARAAAKADAEAAMRAKAEAEAARAAAKAEAEEARAAAKADAEAAMRAKAEAEAARAAGKAEAEEARAAAKADAEAAMRAKADAEAARAAAKAEAEAAMRAKADVEAAIAAAKADAKALSAKRAEVKEAGGAVFDPICLVILTHSESCPLLTRSFSVKTRVTLVASSKLLGVPTNDESLTFSSLDVDLFKKILRARFVLVATKPLEQRPRQECACNAFRT